MAELIYLLFLMLISCANKQMEFDESGTDHGLLYTYSAIFRLLDVDGTICGEVRQNAILYS
jgi:hypothetical protein